MSSATPRNELTVRGVKVVEAQPLSRTPTATIQVNVVTVFLPRRCEG